MQGYIRNAGCFACNSTLLRSFGALSYIIKTYVQIKGDTTQGEFSFFKQKGKITRTKKTNSRSGLGVWDLAMSH